MLLSRRGVIKLAAPGLILGAAPRLARANLILPELGSPFAFPGRAPGFNPAHPAANGMLPRSSFSAIAVGGTLIDLLTGKPFTGTAGTVSVLGGIGTGAKLTTKLSAPYATGITTSSFTFAIIFQQPSQYSPNLLELGPTYTVYISSSNFELYTGTSYPSGFAPQANVPYLLIISAILGGAINFAEVNLSNGKITAQTNTNAGVSVSTNTPAIDFSKNTSTGYVSAAMLAVNNFMSLQQLLAWAADPWTFWYPRPSLQLVENPSVALGRARVMMTR